MCFGDRLFGFSRGGREKIVEGERLRDEAHSLIEDRPKKAAVKFRTVFAFTKGLIPHTSELAVYAAATGQQTVIDQQQQGDLEQEQQL